MNLFAEAELISFGRDLGKKFAKEMFKNPRPIVVELVGDVGVGKTTLTRGIAEGLGVDEPITSPSFTICKRYGFYNKNSKINGVSALIDPVYFYLNHYDFYRLEDPGLMSEDLAESISNDHTITIIEWGESVADVLPEDHITFHITLNDDGSRTIVESTKKESK